MDAPEKIDFVSLWSKDLEKQKQFFVDVLGLEALYEDENVVVLHLEGTRLVIHRATEDDSNLDGHTRFGFLADDLDELTEHLANSDVKILDDRKQVSPSQRVTVVSLPGGQELEFLEK
jgi:catechol 2,3-dioxygenase-like lactoylglutathione lyase family enzyme